MCVNTSLELGKWLCCCCMSMTTGMIVIGALLTLGTVVDLCYENWGGAAWNTIFIVPFILAIAKLDCPNRRKFIVISYIAKTVCELIGGIVMSFFLRDLIDFDDYCYYD